jgi:hypothetical protein
MPTEWHFTTGGYAVGGYNQAYSIYDEPPCPDKYAEHYADKYVKHKAALAKELQIKHYYADAAAAVFPADQHTAEHAEVPGHVVAHFGCPFPDCGLARA